MSLSVLPFSSILWSNALHCVRHLIAYIFPNPINWSKMMNASCMYLTYVCNLPIQFNHESSMKTIFGVGVQPINNVTSAINDGNSKVFKVLKKKGQGWKYMKATDYWNIPCQSVFLTEDEARLKAPNPLTLHYGHDLNLWLRISYSIARSCADHCQLLLGLANNACLCRRSSNMRSTEAYEYTVG